MTKISIMACLLAVVLTASAPAAAKLFELPPDNPAATVDLPSGWKPSETEHGVEATSADSETYVAFETATAKAMNQLIDEDLAFLAKSGVIIDRSTQQTQDTTMNEVPVSFMHWKGRDKDGPTAVTLGIFGLSDNLILLMTAWSSPAGDKTNGPALDKVLASVKRR